MIDQSSLDMQIDSITGWIIKAGKSLKCFYNKDKGVFWRNTFMINKDQNIHPTSTNRSFYALYEYLRFLYEEDLEGEYFKEVSMILKDIAEKYLSLLPENPDIVRKSKTNQINMFTDSHLLVSVSLLRRLEHVLSLHLDVDKVIEAARTMANENIEKLRDWKGGKVSSEDEVHHFVTLHIIRGLDSYFGWDSDKLPLLVNGLGDRVKEDTLRLLAYNSAGVSYKYDPAELAFCVALLNRFPTPDASLLTRSSARSIADSQAKDGAWPTARYVSYEGQGMLHVSSYEIALTLTQLLSRKICEGDIEVCEIVLPALNRAFEMVKSNFNMVDYVTGWSNDHTRQSGLIESWATATVLAFLISYHDVLIQLRQQLILKKYYNICYDNPSQLLTWQDMVPAFRQANWIDMDYLDTISDPTKDSALLKKLKLIVIKPIGDDWVHRPAGTFLIFYGPTGTRKTTLVTKLARTLRWPLLILSSSDFLRNGLEGFEAETAKIFDDLFRLRRVVVLLDECEEFFKIRPKTQRTESRTIGAFITGGMLPRLQKLHDKKWVMLSLVTNTELDELDSAVTRIGRFDYIQEIGNPCLDAQVRYIKGRLTNAKQFNTVKRALEKYEQYRKKHPKAECISFSLLDRLIEKIEDMKQKVSVNEVDDLVRAMVSQKRAPFLTDYLE